MLPYMFCGQAYLPINSSVNVVVDGNSIYAGFSTVSMATLLSQRFSGSGATFSSTAISGQTWDDMTTVAADVDALTITPGKYNILVCAEGTNSVDPLKTNLTGAQVVSKATAYISARKVVNPKLHVVLCSALPRGPLDASQTARNVALNTSDAAFLSDPAAVGANSYVNHRSAAGFAHDGLASAGFTANESWWQDGASNGAMYVHPSPSGVAAMVDRIELALRGIRRSTIQLT